MKCPRCQGEAPPGAAFCPQCGARLGALCDRCGTENAPTHKFCTKCGAALSGGSPQTSDDVAFRRSGEAERRQLTVMFCDLVGSTALSERLDPEDLRDIVRAYQHASADVIGLFQGTIAQYLGDGLLVYFGYPQAHDDDAERAMRTGLGILDRLKELNARAGDVRVSVRIGIHTGLVVVGEVGGGLKREHLALGETPNIAARLQGLAEPDTIVVSGATHRLIRGRFSCRDLGRQVLKGASTPIEIFQLLGETPAGESLAVTAGTRLTPLVGREEEVGLLLARWEAAREGYGQVAVLSGEAGIGKSRLVQVLASFLFRVCAHDGELASTAARAAREQAELAIALSAEENFPYWSAAAGAFSALALINEGKDDEPLAAYLQSVSAYRAMGAEMAVTHFCAFLADAHRQAGRREDGLRAVTEGLRVVKKNDEHIAETELYRLKGELLL
jgi:class 3 adenylate cyclase